MSNSTHSLLSAAILVSAIAFAASPAHAVLVSFDTTGTFNCNGISGCSVSTTTTTNDTVSITKNGTTEVLTYYGSSNAGLSLPSSTNFGDVVSCNQAPNPDTCTDNSTQANAVSFTGVGFSLGIIETNLNGVPVNLSGNIVDSLVGSVASNYSTLFLNFPTTTLTLGGQVVYSLDPQYSVPQPNSNAGDVTLESQVSAAAPEPVLFGVTGLGFLGLMASRLRRRRS